MLSVYSCWDFFILPYTEGKFDYVTSFVKSIDESKRHSPTKSLDKGTMDNRGQMGIYWKSLVEKD